MICSTCCKMWPSFCMQRTVSHKRLGDCPRSETAVGMIPSCLLDPTRLSNTSLRHADRGRVRSGFHEDSYFAHRNCEGLGSWIRVIKNQIVQGWKRPEFLRNTKIFLDLSLTLIQEQFWCA